MSQTSIAVRPVYAIEPAMTGGNRRNTMVNASRTDTSEITIRSSGAASRSFILEYRNVNKARNTRMAEKFNSAKPSDEAPRRKYSTTGYSRATLERCIPNRETRRYKINSDAPATTSALTVYSSRSET